MSDEHTGPASLSNRFDDDPDEVRSMYDEWVETYDADVEAWDYKVPETIAGMLLEASGGVPDGQVLDAGCGIGRSGVALRDAGFHDLVGIDLSPASVATAAERGIYTETLVADLTEPLPFDDDRFAAAISAGVFSYVGNPGPTLREMIRIVRPGGTIIVSQRTDIWDLHECDAALEQLDADGLCSDITTTDPMPYLPEHPEFGDDIRAIYVTLTVA